MRSGPAPRWRLAALACLLGGACGHALPQGGVPGADADALAHRMERAVDAEAWARTGAVRFVFRGETRHLWDKARGLDRVELLARDEVILLDVGKKSGRAWRKGQEVTEPAARQKLVDKAYQRFCNDTFWFNPIVKLFDEGVTRTRVVDERGESLIIHYASGGVTPGDTYHWLVGPGDLPRAWRMFVKILRIKGLETSYEDWTTLPTGAKVSRLRRAFGLTAVRFTEVAGAATLAELTPGADPFAAIVE
jgi:hypothetical protein